MYSNMGRGNPLLPYFIKFLWHQAQQSKNGELYESSFKTIAARVPSKSVYTQFFEVIWLKILVHIGILMEPKSISY